jgi:hypothetical protein
MRPTYFLTYRQGIMAMAWAQAADFQFSEGRYSMKWPDGLTTTPCLISIVDEKPYVTYSIMGVNFYADPIANGFQVEVPDPVNEDPDAEHQIEDEENPPPPIDSPFAAPVPEPLPGPPLAPGDEVVPVAK